MKRIGRPLLGLLFMLIAAFGFSQQITLTSPTDDTFVKRSITFSYNVTGASQQVTVRIEATGPNNFKTTIEKRDNPNTDGKISGSQTLSLSAAAPEGQYTFRIVATEPGKTYPVITRKLNVDGTAPKFLSFNPIGSVFVKGTVRITATLQEANVEEWRVTVDGADIPDNTGTGTNIDVRWDTTSIEKDGPQTVKITVKDKAENEASQNITVTVDRVRPSSNITFPRAVDGVRKGATFLVQADITDKGRVDVTGVDVILYTMDNKYIMRVPRVTTSQNGDVLKWTGRVRKGVKLPKQFKILVRCIDKAGNRGVDQSVTIKVKG